METAYWKFFFIFIFLIVIKSWTIGTWKDVLEARKDSHETQLALNIEVAFYLNDVICFH